MLFPFSCIGIVETEKNVLEIEGLVFTIAKYQCKKENHRGYSRRYHLL